MSLNTLATVTLSALLILGAVAGGMAEDTPAVVVDPAIASMTPDQLVAARRAAMKEDGGILRGADKLTGSEAVAVATKILQNFTNFPSLFAEGSITADSHALPVIWEQFDDFKSIFAADQESAKVMLAAAKAGDTAGYVAAFQQIATSCGECHQTYRAR